MEPRLPPPPASPSVRRAVRIVVPVVLGALLLGTQGALFWSERGHHVGGLDPALAAASLAVGVVLLYWIASVTWANAARERAAAKLEASERRARAILDRAADPMFIVGDGGRFLAVNPAACTSLGYTREELLGMTVQDVDPTAVPSNHEAEWARVFAGESATIRGIHTRKDGTSFPVEVHVALLPGPVPTMLGVVRDISELRRTQVLVADLARAQEAVTRERGFLQQVVDGVPEALVVVSPTHEVLLANRKACEAAGRTPAPGTRCFSLAHGRDVPCDPEECPLATVMRTRRPTTKVHRHTDARGATQYVEVAAAPLTRPDGTLIGMVETARDVTERRRAEDELRERSRLLAFQATHDRLTGLPNRTLLHDRLRQALAKARRAGTRVAVLFVDLDRFKPVNDTLGHDVGDALLQVVARRLRQSVRETDTVARMGGDEFVVLLEGLADAIPAAAVARKLAERVCAPVEIGIHEVRVGSSVGVAVYPEDGQQEDALLRAADEAMYLAKQGGGGAVRFYGDDHGDAAELHAALQEDLYRALAGDAFGVAFQPQVDLTNGAIVGLEVLARWTHPERGPVEPEVFRAVAARAGFSDAVEERVLSLALARLKRWEDRGIAPAWLALNLDATACRNAVAADRILERVRAMHLVAERIMVEVPEAALGGSVPAFEDALARLASAGIRVAVDDFGTGATSLPTLRRFPLSLLKIDRAFVRGLGEDPGDAGVVAGILGLAAGMGVDTLAEGVEQEAHRRILLAHGCVRGQGSLFAPALLPDEIEPLLEQGRIGHANVATA